MFPLYLYDISERIVFEVHLFASSSLTSSKHVSIPSLSGVGNPLRGPLDAPESAGPGVGGPRFLALSDAYDLNLRVATWKAWQVVSSMIHEETHPECGTSSSKANLHEGIYAFVGGPRFVLSSIIEDDIYNGNGVSELVV